MMTPFHWAVIKFPDIKYAQLYSVHNLLKIQDLISLDLSST